jgi:hypothetical protein
MIQGDSWDGGDFRCSVFSSWIINEFEKETISDQSQFHVNLLCNFDFSPTLISSRSHVQQVEP